MGSLTGGSTGGRTSLAEAVRSAIRPLSGGQDDYDALLELIGEARFVLLGEASHGTHEFYRARAEITKRLITERGFAAIAAEADWPDAYRVNRYVRGLPSRGGDGAGDRDAPDTRDATAEEALRDFQRFPQWMWRNADVLDLVGWLRTYNETQPAERRVGFYGLDLYSLYASIEAVIEYLDRVDPGAAKRARGRYACFEMFEKDEQAYGHAASAGLAESCEDAVVDQLVELQGRGADRARRGGALDGDEQFFAEQNARVAKNAEAYYREMFRGRDTSWNLRDQHMAETLDALARHLGGPGRAPDRADHRDDADGGPAKIVVWAHNSHLGDARATQMSERGELNLGQLVRERYGDSTVIVGFTTYAGTVTAAADWGTPAERKRVRPALPGSYEALFHEVSEARAPLGTTPDAPTTAAAPTKPGAAPRFYLSLRDGNTAAEVLRQPRLERFIGVIYRPETERWSHYYEANLVRQFDAVFHFDQTRALEPMERTARWEAGEVPQTFPSAA